MVGGWCVDNDDGNRYKDALCVVSSSSRSRLVYNNSAVNIQHRTDLKGGRGSY